MYLGWYDDARNKSPEEKIAEAVERFVTKFGEQPTVCLVSPGTAAGYDGLEVKTAAYVRPNHFWVGLEEPASAGVLAA